MLVRGLFVERFKSHHCLLTRAGQLMKDLLKTIFKSHHCLLTHLSKEFIAYDTDNFKSHHCLLTLFLLRMMFRCGVALNPIIVY